MKKIIAFGFAPLALVFAFSFPTTGSAEAAYSLQTQMQAAISRPARPARPSALPSSKASTPTQTRAPAPTPAPTLTPTQVPTSMFVPPQAPAPTQTPPPAVTQAPRPIQTPTPPAPPATNELAQRKTLLNEIVGYGKNTIGGANGEIYHVTTLANSGPGSLRSAVTDSRPLWIIFDVNGVIDLNRQSLRIQSYKTIDGRNADITIRNAPVQIFNARNVIIENIKIGANDQMIGMRLLTSNNIWIDHVSFLGGITGDGDPLYANLLAIMDGSSNVTVSWSRFVNQDKGIEIGHSNTEKYHGDESMYVTLHHNYLNAARRNPRVNRAHVHAFNNVVDRWSCNGYGMASSNNGKLFAEGNVLTAKTGCKNVCKASVSAIRSGDITSMRSCTVDKAGVVLSQNNLFQSGAQLVGRNASPEQIFNPRQYYEYVVEAASQVMEQAVASTAGATR